MRVVGLLIILLLSLTLFGQKINYELKSRLDSIHYKDQALRELILPNTTENQKTKVLHEFGIDISEFEKDSWKYIINQDSLNFNEIKNIIRKYGYPGKSLVGEPTNKTAWLIIQHSNEIPTYFPIIKEAGNANEISYTLVAAMEDRMLMYEDKEQIYGTQSSSLQHLDKILNQTIEIQFIWPIANSKSVNEKRKQAGFTTTIEEYAKQLGIEYKEYTLEEIRKMSE